MSCGENMSLIEAFYVPTQRPCEAWLLDSGQGERMATESPGVCKHVRSTGLIVWSSLYSKTES